MKVIDKKSLTPEKWAEIKYPAFIQQDTDGEWGAWYPDLGMGLFFMFGKDPNEAMERLEKVRIEKYDFLMSSKTEIPEPTYYGFL